ncbi:MAG TPA: tetratricopeptide repeat protein, partial [Kofleriaceae bacterium]|nr:tetratricopeptide repeat protein [Kofleriaceae bacterium]
MRGLLGVVLLALLLAGGCGRGDRSSERDEPTVRITDTRTGDPRERAWALLDSIDWSADPAIDWSAPVADATQWIAPAGYAGSDACAECHPDEATSYAGHAMARTGLRRIDPRRDRDILAAFSAGELVPHERSGLSYRPYRRGRQLYIEESIDDPSAGRVHSLTVEVTHTYAAGAIGRAFGYARGDHVYQVPLDWYPGAKRWALDPSFGLGNPRFSRPFSSFCLACHTDYPTHRATSADLAQHPLPAGVGCERCHGPGERHSHTGRSTDIVNPARLPPARQLDVCAQCHLQGTAEILRPGHTAYDYRPGDPLFAHRANYVEAHPGRDEFQLTAQADRLTRSACYRESKGALTCTTCHDPHETSVGRSPAAWRASCLGCHQTEACTGPAAARAANGDACVDCHMRRDTPHDFRLSVPGIALPIVDHWIRRSISAPTPVGAPARPRPAGEITAWPTLLGEPVGGGEVIEGLALRNSGRTADALPLLVRALRDRPPVRELYAFFADQYGGFAAQRPDPVQRARALANRRAALAAAVRAAPDDPQTLLDYARASLESGDSAEATHALDRILRLAPNHPDALSERAAIHFRAGHFAPARPLLARAIEIGPAPVDARIMAAVLARDGRDRPSAIAHLEAARDLAPGDLWVLDELTALYRAGDDPGRAAALAPVRGYFAARGATVEASRAHRLLSPAQLRHAR